MTGAIGSEKMCFSVQSPTVNNVSVLAIRASVLLPNFSSNYGFTCRMKFEKVVFLGGRKYRELGVFAQVFSNELTNLFDSGCMLAYLLDSYQCEP